MAVLGQVRVNRASAMVWRVVIVGMHVQKQPLQRCQLNRAYHTRDETASDHGWILGD